MVGIAIAYFLFPAFNSETDANAWLNVYLFLAGLALISFLVLFFSDFDENYEIPGADLIDDVRQMFLLCAKYLTLVFIVCAFLFVMVEQGIMTWLPTFNKDILSLNDSLSVQMASILAISLAIGRVLAGFLVKKIHWLKILTVCIVVSMLIVALVLPKALNLESIQINTISKIPLIGFVFPIVGLFIAPVYPLINSVVLSSMPKRMHSSMAGLIIIFSALGGTLGSRIIGYLFEHIGGEKAFFFMLIPMTLLLLSLFMFNKTIKVYENTNL